MLELTEKVDALTQKVTQLVWKINGVSVSTSRQIEEVKATTTEAIAAQKKDVDDKFFASEPIDGKELINNLISNYLTNW